MKPIFLLTILLLLFTAIANAESNPPVQSTIKNGKTNQKNTDNKQRNTEHLQYSTEQSPIFVRITHTNTEQIESENDRKHKNENTAHKNKIEIINVIFNGALVIATIVLAFFTYGLIRATFALVKSGEISERAYIFGITGMYETSGNLKLIFFNSGKTVAHIKGISVDIFNGPQLPDIPTYNRKEYIQDIPANHQDTSPWKQVIGINVSPFIYGRIYYYDVFHKKEHSSGFVYRMNLDGTIVPAYNVPIEYTTYD
jgi:hypothetical protein